MGILRHCPINYFPFPAAHYNTITGQKWFCTCTLRHTITSTTSNHYPNRSGHTCYHTITGQKWFCACTRRYTHLDYKQSLSRPIRSYLATSCYPVQGGPVSFVLFWFDFLSVFFFGALQVFEKQSANQSKCFFHF